MHVLATAGHVDHGKSTLVRALTGTDPDRLAEEKRRGLTIELGFAWTTIGGAGEVAFVDVPGHQKFLSTTLAGLGPIPAVLFVVAADEGWRRQSAEHLAALDALDVSHGILVMTRADLADPAPAAAHALEELSASSLRGIGWRGVSARTGAGMSALRTDIARLVAGLPDPEPRQRQRLWIDRVFTVAGAGTVVTGTLPAGRIAVGDVLELNGGPVSVRGLESLGRQQRTVEGTARVAVALRGVDRGSVNRGDALLAPGGWAPTSLVDVVGTSTADLPRQLVLHIGTAAVPVTRRVLSATHLRLTLDRPLPLALGDRALLRDPGRQRVAAGITVVDLDPPPFARRGAAAGRAAELARRGAALDPVAEVGRRPFATVAALAGLGLHLDPGSLPPGLVDLDGRLVTVARHEALLREAAAAVAGHATGMPAETLRQRLGLPDSDVLRALLAGSADLVPAGGHVRTRRAAVLPAGLTEAAENLAKRWAGDPLDAPTAEELRDLGLDNRALGLLQSFGLLLRVSETVAVGPEAVVAALAVLGRLKAPFSVSEARSALGSSRRVTLPLLGYLDAKRHTVRDASDRRRVR